MKNRITFSGYNEFTRPAWIGREMDVPDLLPGGAKLDEASFTAYTAAGAVTLSAAAAAGAVALAVLALPVAIPAGVVLNFAGKLAFVQAPAAAGAVALTVLPLADAIPTAAVAQFAGWTGKYVPSGTFVSRTRVQRAAGVGFHPAIDGEDEYGLTAHDVQDLTVNDDVSILLPGRAFPVKENFLPNSAALLAVAALAARLRAAYFCTIGSE